MKVGDIVKVKIIHDGGYAFWAIKNDKIVFIHITELSVSRPIPDSAIPLVGDEIEVKLFKQVEEGEHLPADITHDGKFNVSFAGSVAIIKNMDS